MTKFEKQCNEISNKLHIDVMFFDDERKNNKPHEDDGNLHVSKRGLRACFDVGDGQSLGGKEQNKRARIVMDELGVPINNDCLVNETEECDDQCPHCGRNL